MEQPCAAVLIDRSRSFMNLHIRYVHWIAARLPNCEIWGFCRQHLATLATPTIRSIKCKKIAGYGVFRPLLPHPSTDRNETRTQSSLSPQKPSREIWYKSVHNRLSYRGRRQTHRQTDRHTNQRRQNILPRFCEENKQAPSRVLKTPRVERLHQPRFQRSGHPREERTSWSGGSEKRKTASQFLGVAANF